MDLTGPEKPSTKFSQLSTAVTQGSDVFVINALKAYLMVLGFKLLREMV